jgi:CDGSH-type Zn-finger protein
MEETPLILDLEPGTYYWCSCGKSGNIPFYYGSHNGTKFVPVEFKSLKRRK